MHFMDKLAQKVSKGTRNLSQKTDEFIEITELKVEIKNIEDEIEEAKLYIGELVYKYCLSDYDNMPLTEIKQKCKEIYRMDQQINRLKEKINKIRGLEYCHFCGERVNENENYCAVCGHKITKN